jgi:hypothetical protein
MRFIPLSVFAILCVTTPAQAQVSLSLSSGSGNPGSSVTLSVSLRSTGTPPASLQWAFSYSTSVFTGVRVVAGPSATNAGKGVSCGAGANPGTTNCIVFGINTSGMANGIVAEATFTISRSTPATSAVVQMNNPVAAAGDGAGITASASGNTVTIVQPTPVQVGTPGCSPSLILTPGFSICAVTKTLPAPPGLACDLV